MSEPLVYIILVNYRVIELTIECIISLQKITYKNYKIVVVDNSPNEGLDEELKQNFTSVILLKSDKNSGFAGGNNIGIKYAIENGAKYVVLLNNDTTVENNFLEPLLETFNDRSVGLATGKIMYSVDRDKIWYGGGKINWIRGGGIMLGSGKSDNSEYNNKSEVTFASGCLFCLKSDIIEKVGVLNEDYFTYQEDTDYCVRLRRMGFSIIYEPKSKIYHQINATTQKSDFPLLYYQFRNRLYFIKKHSPIILKQIGYIYLITVMIIKSIYWTIKREFKKVRLIISAIRDFSKNNMGAMKG